MSADQRVSDLASLPLEIIAVTAAGRQWHIEAVRDHDRLLAASEGLSEFPFGLLLWESAAVLADALVSCGGVKGLRVLELGCGTGLPGLAASWLGAHVTQTDHSAEALALAARNATRNGISGIQVRHGDWMAWQSTGTYDLVMGADVLYDAALHDLIAGLLARTVAPGGRVLLTDPCRPATTDFVAGLKAAGWMLSEMRVEVPALNPLRAGETVAVSVLAGRRAADSPD